MPLQQPVKAAYWPSWILETSPPSAINTTLFTHVYFAFLMPSNGAFSFELSDSTAAALSQFTASLRRKNPHVKTMFSIGGGGSDSALFALIASTITGRGTSAIGAHAALFDPHTNLSSHYDLRSWISAGVPRNKMVMGISLCGKSWTSVWSNAEGKGEEDLYGMRLLKRRIPIKTKKLHVFCKTFAFILVFCNMLKKDPYFYKKSHFLMSSDKLLMQ